MVDAVVDPEVTEEILRRPVDVNQVVNKEIASVSHEKSRRKRKREIPENEPEENQKCGRQCYAEQGRHRYPVLVFRMVMMNAMHRVLKLLAGLGGRRYVKQISVYQIFDPAVNEPAKEKQSDSKAYG
jgi:hypothetical protein